MISTSGANLNIGSLYGPFRFSIHVDPERVMRASSLPLAAPIHDKKKSRFCPDCERSVHSCLQLFSCQHCYTLLSRALFLAKVYKIKTKNKLKIQSFLFNFSFYFLLKKSMPKRKVNSGRTFLLSGYSKPFLLACRSPWNSCCCALRVQVKMAERRRQ